MSVRGSRTVGGAARTGASRRLIIALLAGTLLTGCDDTLEPFLERDDAVFSMFGYLDLLADTQWVRVMPVRRSLFLEPGPLDAVVTLEHTGTGRVVTLHDSLFSFVDQRLGSVGYAHNFWTTEPLEPDTRYRLSAVRPDGASSTAVIDMPAAPDILFVEDSRDNRRGTVLSLFQVRAERVLSVETIYDMGRYAGNPPVLMAANSEVETEYAVFPSQVPGMIGIHVDLDTLLIRPGLVDVIRRWFRVAVAPSDWPYDVGLSDLEITQPGIAPSNVENGVGFVGGVATRVIPFDACRPRVPTPGGIGTCATEISARTASLAGRVLQEPCGEPYTLAPIRLTELAADGGTVRTWSTGWSGQYRFEGVQPNVDLVLELPGEPSVLLPPLEQGEHYTVEDILVAGGC